MTKIQELGSSLQKLLSTLKKNREMIPLEVLKSHYQQPYYALIREINKTASAFAKAVLINHLILNPDISLDKQAAVINQVIAESGIDRQMSSCISRTYNVEQLYQMALELRQKIECALWPYIDLKTCLVFDLDNPDAEPVTYNTLTRQICRDGIWENQEIDLQWKFLFYPNARIHPPYKTLPEEKKLLALAYELYNDMEDSNTAYNVTLDLVIDEIEHWIRDNQIGVTAESGENPRVVIIIEDGIISTVLASSPGIQIDIIELDRNYVDSELRSSTYDAILKEPDLQNCSYSLHVPGYAQETEVDE